MFGRKQRQIEQLEQTVSDLRTELAGLQERFRISLGYEEELRALVSKQAREILALEVKPAKKRKRT
jgi:cell division protein FtsB